METGIGHNSGVLKKAAEKAQMGLATVYRGEEDVFDGWIMYGEALNEGREQFPSDEQFGQWVRDEQLDQHTHPDRQAAMWAAANPDEFHQTKEDNPKVRTVRGLHSKWKQKKTEEKADKVEKLVQRQRSTNSEGEKQAVQQQLDRMKESGVNVDKVVAKMDKGDTEAQEDIKTSVVYEIVEIIYGNKDLIASCLIGLAKDNKQLEKLKGMFNEH